MEKKIIKFKIDLKTGLHIGGISDVSKIGGVDSPVIKAPDGLPYIPGSSLKGKLRSIMRMKYNIEDNLKEADEESNENLRRLLDMFGRSSNPKLKKSALGTLIFRDSFVNEEETKNNLGITGDLVENKDLLYEEKAENKIKRDSGTAESPRFIERVKRGVVFDGEIIIRKIEDRDIEAQERELKELLKLLETSDYLGGSGTRGYGYVKIEFLESN